IIPAYMVRCMCGWRQTWEVWPALVVAGGSFAVFQLTFATIHAYLPRLVLYPMTDIGGGIFSLILTAIFLKFWKPKNEWHFAEKQPVAWVESSRPTILNAGQVVGLEDSAHPTASHAPGHAAAGGEPGGVSARSTAQEPPLTGSNMTV